MKGRKGIAAPGITISRGAKIPTPSNLGRLRRLQIMVAN
jgi:hypothetical protein